MRSKQASVIDVDRGFVTSVSLSFVTLGQRRLEKEKPPPKDVVGGVSMYTIPVDLMRVAGFPPDLIDTIEEITLEYRK